MQEMSTPPHGMRIACKVFYRRSRNKQESVCTFVLKFTFCKAIQALTTP